VAGGPAFNDVTQQPSEEIMSDNKTTRKQPEDRTGKRTKLTLSRETLRDLSVQEANEVKGGFSLHWHTVRTGAKKGSFAQSFTC
jgi:hypothetical protein